MTQKLNIGLLGSTGKMGIETTKFLEANTSHNISIAISSQNKHDIHKLLELSDVIIDFSTSLSTHNMLYLLEELPKPVVICTTGLTDDVKKAMIHASKFAPILYSNNTSYCINVISEILPILVKKLSIDYDITVLEQHHKHKKDVPSGTASMLQNIIETTLEDEIRMHSIRAGGTFGEHIVKFTGQHDELIIMHNAHSRQVFAKGAVMAAEFLLKQAPGIYSMHDVYAEFNK
jgi:4-hydroxy-tetrahydrodipicolinate reductase